MVSNDNGLVVPTTTKNNVYCKSWIVRICILSCFFIINVQAQGDGTYAGYRQRQSCIAAGSTDQDGLRVKASIDFYLCCHDPRFGPGKLCCENCLKQWSDYFDWIYPCFENQGGELLKKKTELAMDTNFYKWDKNKYLWICAGNRTASLSYTLVIAIVTLLMFYLS